MSVLIVGPECMEKNKRGEEGLRHSMQRSEGGKEVFFLPLKTEQDWVRGWSYTMFTSQAGAIG